MTQTIPGPTASPTQPAAAHAPVLAVAPAPAPAAHPVSKTVGRLQLLSLAVILGGVLAGVLGAGLFLLQFGALQRAEDNISQLVRVQQIQTDLLSADAAATNAFLVGGLEPAAQRLRYDRAIAETTRLIAEAAQAQPADQAALAALNADVLDYAAAIEQARANNRQGLPVGAQYLRLASAGLRADALPILDNLVTANTERSADEMESRAATWFLVVGGLVLAGLVLAQIWLARHFRRTLNPSVLAASIVVLLALAAAGAGLGVTGQRIDDLRTATFSRLTAAAQARIAANDAKSNESLTLIARGSGSAFEKAWAASAAKVETSLGSVRNETMSDTWTRYVAVHKQIRSLDDGGKWDAAVDKATGTGKDSANTSFTAFDEATASFLGQLADSTAAGLDTPRTILLIEAVVALLAGLGAAILARRGVAHRLREYR